MIFLDKNKASIALSLLISIVFTNNLTLASNELQEKQIISQNQQCQVAITRQDIPTRFKEMTASELEDTRKRLSQEELIVNQITGFQTNNLPLGLIISGTMSLSDRRAQEDPHLVRQRLLQAFTGTPENVVSKHPGVNPTVSNIEELPNLDNIGDGSAAWKIPLRIAGFSFRIDLVIFQRGKIIGLVGAGYIEGDVAAVPVGNLARILDARILATCH